VASISRLLEIIGLFCKRDPEKRRYSAKETYNFKAPTNRSHPISKVGDLAIWLDLRIIATSPTLDIERERERERDLAIHTQLVCVKEQKKVGDFVIQSRRSSSISKVGDLALAIFET